MRTIVEQKITGDVFETEGIFKKCPAGKNRRLSNISWENTDVCCGCQDCLGGHDDSYSSTYSCYYEKDKAIRNNKK